MPENDLCLLALHGGGVRGLSTLQIVKQLMDTINPDSPPKPCDYFDMIGGTSTGGLIAIMLGRLRMTVDECIDAYVSLSDRMLVSSRKSTSSLPESAITFKRRLPSHYYRQLQ
ncbi:FabD/lysophospholipase-like protein [Lentithecium fluviatile CBS 122367]|uniref:FabD/lysophospholipase-like protein n=1 Tax=Lentithecium fluviatile CBS 122367 TaxID=1168545 RepID=A0A6G1IVW3_9PLEO|nr:FabD/lysophospholipase-like protein [Lentithecium fluviatile CBS 122367]